MKRRKKRLRLKKEVKIILLVILILLLVIGIKSIKNKDKVATPKEINPTIELLNQKTYLNKVKNSSDVEIKKEWENLIVKYLDLYFKSLINLETKDVKNIFTDPNGSEAYYIQNAIDMLVYHHKIQFNDMKLTKAKYDIEYKNVEIEDNTIKITFLQDDFYNFKYLNDIESKAIDIENEIIIRKEKDKYTIDALRIVQSNFVMFTNEIDMKDEDAKEQIDILKQKYIEAIDKDLKNNKELMEEAKKYPYETNIKCDHEYDRDKAVKYSYEYTETRNEDFFAYDDLGGNCQNYVSQSLLAGGIPMDTKGKEQWKHYDVNVNEKNEKKGRSTSWTGTINFYNYAKNNDGFGLCSDVDNNIFYAEKGDVAHVGYKGFSHAVIVVKQIKDKEGKTIDFLVNSNTASLENYPFLAYPYPNKRVIKVLGYNE